MNNLSVNKYFKALNKIFVSFIFIQLLFVLTTLLIRLNNLMNVAINIEYLKLLKLIVPILAALGLFEGTRFFRRKLKQAQKRFTLAKKLADYRIGHIIQYSFWETPSILAILVYLLTGNWIYLAISGVILLLFLANRPTIDRARRELEI